MTKKKTTPKDGIPWEGKKDFRLQGDGNGRLFPTLDNVVAILDNDPAFVGAIGFDEFSGRICKRRELPFEGLSAVGEWTDDDDALLAFYLATHYGIRRVSDRDMQFAVTIAAHRHRFHEVKDYLNGLVWDGTPRVRYWINGYLGADPSPYHEAVSIKFMIAAVARVMNAPAPTKVDNVLILEGPQYAGKSTVFKILFDPWFTDAAFEIGSTDGLQIIRGQWCVELAELDALNRVEVSRSKRFFSTAIDRYRNPYGRRPVNVIRQCVFGGSVNNSAYLKDDTGNRRFWPVTVGNIALDELAKDKPQLWAEALKLFNDGIPWHVMPEELPLFSEEQDKRYVGDAYEDSIRGYLKGDTDNNHKRRDGVTIGEVLGKGLYIERARWTLAEQQRVGRILARLGYRKRRATDDDGTRPWRYYWEGEPGKR